MMKKIMARGEVLTKSFERKRLTGLSANAADLDSPRITDDLLVSHSPAKGQRWITDHLYRGAVSSVVEHYLDTVGVTGSNPVSRIFEPRLCITLMCYDAATAILTSARRLIFVIALPGTKPAASLLQRSTAGGLGILRGGGFEPSIAHHLQSIRKRGLYNYEHPSVGAFHVRAAHFGVKEANF
jgi:hypothetical protein